MDRVFQEKCPRRIAGWRFSSALRRARTNVIKSIRISFGCASIFLVLCGCRDEFSKQRATKDSAAIRGSTSDAAVPEMIPVTGAPPLRATQSRIQFEMLDGNEVPLMVYSNGLEAGETAIIESLGGGVGITAIDGDG